MYKLKSKYIKLDNSTRLHGASRPIVGLTGGIASGKSTVAEILNKKGLFVIDADQLIKDIYRKRETINFIDKLLPQAISNGEVDFKVLRAQFFKNAEIKHKIENFLYQRLPIVFQEKLDQNLSHSFVVYDVPLLFEKKLELQFDYILNIFCSPNIQLERIIRRDSSSPQLAQKIIDQQFDVNFKIKKSDYSIENNLDIDHLRKQVDRFLEILLNK